MEKILRRNQNGLRKGRSTIGQILTVRRIIEGVKARQIPATLLFVDFSKAFGFVHRGKMEKILLAYGKPKEIVTAIMILYRNTKSMVRSPNGDTAFLNILAGVLQADTLASCLFVICLYYMLRISVDRCNEYGQTLELARSRRFHTKKITDADYADDLALLSDNSYNAQKLLHILEKSVAFIGLHVDETLNKKFSLFKKVEDIVYLGCNIE